MELLQIFETFDRHKRDSMDRSPNRMTLYLILDVLGWRRSFESFPPGSVLSLSTMCCSKINIKRTQILINYDLKQ